MLRLISFSTKKDLPFQPGVFTKCAAAIESCKLIEQLHAANKMVENNYSNLTEAQYITLKNRIARHPCAEHLVMIPTNCEYTIFMKRSTFIACLVTGIVSWLLLGWWLL